MNRVMLYIFTIFSALLYAVACMFSHYFWWMIFLFPVPLFFISYKTSIRFFPGYVWGFVSSTLVLSGFCAALFSMSSGPYFWRVIPIFIMVLYMPFFSAFIFELLYQITSFFKIKQFWQVRLITTILGIILFVESLTYMSLLPFGSCTGHMFMHPLIALIGYPEMVWFVQYIGILAGLVLVLLVSAAISFFCFYPGVAAIVLFLISCLPFVLGFSNKHVDTVPEWVNNIILLPTIIKSENPLATGKQIQQILLSIIAQYPQKSIVIFPESSIYCSTLCKTHEAIALWSQEHLGKKLDVIVGTFTWKKDQLYNVLLHVYNGKKKRLFHKKQVLPLTEQIPSWLQYEPIKKAYFNGLSAIWPSRKMRKKFFILEKTPLVPYICSELFCNVKPDDAYANTPLLAVCNDIWFYWPEQYPYTQDLLLRSAQLKAIAWQRSILYCSFTYAVYISRLGKTFSLSIFYNQ